MTSSECELIARRVAEILGAQLQPDMLTTKQVAQRLSVSERTAWDLISRGNIPSYKIAGARRVATTDLDRYLADLREGPTDG